MEIPQITIRQARLDDWQTIADFNCRLASETEGKILDRQQLEPGVRALLADESKGRYFVATDATGKIVGQVMHTLEWSDWRNGQIWWLQSVFVAEEFRRQGVFRRLFEHLSELAQNDPDVIGLRLYVETDNERGQRTYLDLGMRRSSYFVMEHLFRDVPKAQKQ